MGTEIGFAGLGQMGKWMAINILKGGFPLLAYDLRRDAVDDLAARGAGAAGSLSELGGRCSRIVLSLPDTAAVESVLFGPDGLEPRLRPGQIVVDCGTTHPLFAREAAASLKKRGAAFVDAPVSGMESRAKDGTLTIMAGGDEDAFGEVRPLLEAMGKTVLYMGVSGNGQLAKMANNVLFNISCAAMAEILPMAAAIGLDPHRFASAVGTGTGQSYGFDFFAPLVLEGNFKPGYPMKSAYKDMEAVMEIADGNRIPLPVTAAAKQTYEMALAEGHGDENKGAMIKVWEKRLGLKVRRNPDAPPGE